MDTDLQLNFAVCFDHFQHNDQLKNEQYKTPQGSKDNSPNSYKSESIEVVETPSNTCRGLFQESSFSSASTNNTDICVLDSHYASDDLHFLPDDDDQNVDEFIESEEGDEVFLRAANVIDKNEDFTVLQKPTKTRCLCSCDESTEVLFLINSEYEVKQRKPTYSGTDSDVEVLVSEEFIESDWSSGNGLEENNKEKLLAAAESKLCKPVFDQEQKLEKTSASCLQQSCDDSLLPTQESTDLDVSGDELVDAASVTPDMYQNLNRMELLKVIQQQEVRIQALEATVERYHKAQQRLFEHVDALRLELSEIRISPQQSFENLEKNHNQKYLTSTLDDNRLMESGQRLKHLLNRNGKRIHVK